jgi:hypothetical protein
MKTQKSKIAVRDLKARKDVKGGGHSISNQISTKGNQTSSGNHQSGGNHQSSSNNTSSLNNLSSVTRIG